MNKNEIIKLRVMQIDDKDVPAIYIETFNSYLDNVVIPHFEKQLAKKDKKLRHQICKEIREWCEENEFEVENANQSSDCAVYTYNQLFKKLDQIEKRK